MRYLKLTLLTILLALALMPIVAVSLNNETLIIYTRKGDGKTPFLTGVVVLKDSRGVVFANLSNPNYLGNVSDPLTMGYAFTLPLGTYHIEVYKFNMLVGRATVELTESKNVTLICDVLDLPVTIVEEMDPGILIGNVTLKVYDGRGNSVDEVSVGSSGRCIVKDLPYQEYILRVLKFNITIAEERCRIISYDVNSTSQFSIKCKVGDLNVKLIDQVGRIVREGVLKAAINGRLYDSGRVSGGVVSFRQIPIDYLANSVSISLYFELYGIPVDINTTTLRIDGSRNIVVQATLYDLNVKLNDLANRLVNNATIVLKRGDLEVGSFNVAKGELTITQLPASDYILVARRFNILIAEEKIAVHENLSLTLNCKVVDVTVSVSDKYGRSVTQVKIDLLHNGTLIVSSIPASETVKQLPLAEYIVSLWREGVLIGNYSMDLTTYTKPLITYEIRNIPLPSLAIKCVDLNNKLIPKAKVLIYDLMIGNPKETVVENGYALFSDLWPGKYVVMAEFEVSMDSETFMVKSSRNIVNVSATSTSYILVCPVNISGVVKVVDAYGNPLPHVAVNVTTIIEPKNYTWTRETDNNGIARFTDLFGSKYLVQVYIGGKLYLMQAVESPNNFSVELRIPSVQLTPLGILEIQVIQLVAYTILLVVLIAILYYVFKRFRKVGGKSA